MPFFRVLLSRPDARYARLAAILAVITLTLNGCAGLFGGDPLRVSVAGIEPVDGQGLEMRFNVKLRVQNPNESAVNFDGVSLALELNGKPFASGVSDQSGTVPRFGETVVNVPLTVPAFAAVRQAFAFAGRRAVGTDSVHPARQARRRPDKHDTLRRSRYVKPAGARYGVALMRPGPCRQSYAR